MKEKKNSKKSKVCPYKCRFGLWKIIAVLVIIIFSAFIIGGIIKAHHIKSLFVEPTKEQTDYAKTIATEKLQSTGANISNFQVIVGERMRKPYDDPRTIIQVSFYNNATTHIYLVDVNSVEVLLHSETEVFGSFGDIHKPFRREGPLPFGMFPKPLEQGDRNR
jgi:hypothetical protein